MATYLNIDGDRLEMIAADFAGTEKQIDAACRRAVSKLSRHLKTVTLRGVSQLTGIKQSVLRKRLFVSFGGGRKTARLWFGLYAIPLREMNPKQTRAGVKAGKIERQHAFIGTRNGKQEVYRRVKVQKTGTDNRLPIAIQTAKIDQAVNHVIEADILKVFENKFYAFFEREMKWESKK
ncbi:hypothetical protein [Maridesulfovibrio sp.]|uniref:hypothetical protein n=1 Tax=Maridesulfovibrio sp. TaxID=2795000 RepID=UPI003BAAB1EE